MQRLKLTECKHYSSILGKIKGQILVLWCKVLGHEMLLELTMGWVIAPRGEAGNGDLSLALVAWGRAGVCIGALGVALGRHWGDLAQRARRNPALRHCWKQGIKCLLTNTAALCPWQIVSLSLCVVVQQLLVHSLLLSGRLGARKDGVTA